MSDFDPYEAADAPLREKESRLVAELEVVRKLRSDIAAARNAAGTPAPVAAVFGVAGPASPVSEKFKGLGLEQAAAKVLSESDRIELTAKQIWAALSAAGYSLLSDRPEQSVSWALRKRERKVHDVILIGDGKWGMVDWYSQAKQKELRASRNNASTRNTAEHKQRTKDGIANAKQNRLEHWGRRRTITVEQITKAYVALKSGSSRSAAAKAGGMVWPTLNYYWENFEMENWKPGDAFPPKRRAVPKKTAEITRENLWPQASELFGVHTNGNGSQH